MSLRTPDNKVESGVQLFSRLNRKSDLEDINPAFFPDGGPYGNQVIEIVGEPEVDKNEVLIDFIVKCILPNKHNSSWKNSAVILINTEFQISVLKIIKVIETHILKNDIRESKKLIIENALKNLIMFNCYCLEELEVTIYYLEKIIQCNENINLVVIDNLCTYFWSSALNFDMPSYYYHSLKLFELFYNTIKNLHITFIFARHERTNKKKFNNNIDFRIEIEKFDQNYEAIVTNYEKNKIIHVPFKVNTTVEFL